MEMREQLEKPIGKATVKTIVRNVNQEGLADLYRLLFDDEKRVSDNAAWVLTHISRNDRKFLEAHRDELIDKSLHTSSVTKQRLILRLLVDIPFPESALRTDFLDYCLQGIPDINIPYGVRSLCMKLAFMQCRHYPELLGELRSILELMEPQSLSSGLVCARRNVLASIDSYKN